MKIRAFSQILFLGLLGTLIVGCSDGRIGAKAGTSADVVLTVGKTGNGLGTVVSTLPDGRLSCGQACVATSARFTPGTQVTLSATADTASGSVFVVWGGACASAVQSPTCTLTATADTTVTATFGRSAGANLEEIVAVTTNNQLTSFSRSAPETVTTLVSISGLVSASEEVLGIDYRPLANGAFELVAVTRDDQDAGRVYTLNAATGVATFVANLSAPLTRNADDTSEGFGMDVDPVTGNIRLVNEAGELLTIAANGTVTAATAGVSGLTGLGFTNAFAGATSTILFGLRTETGATPADELVILNGGATQTVGPLGKNLGDVNGFEVANGNFEGFVVATEDGSLRLYAVDLTSGALDLLGSVGVGQGISGIRGITVVPGLAPPAPGDAYALTDPNVLISFNRATPGALLTRLNILGLQAGESLVGIDFRPSDQKLIGLGSNSNLYSIDTASGFATLVAGLSTTDGTSTTAFPLAAGATFGMDFDPTDDQLRVVSSASDNFWVDTATGTVTEWPDLNHVDDTNPDAPNTPAFSSAVAYTNSFTGTDSTEVFYIDIGANQLAVDSGSLSPNKNDGSIEGQAPLGIQPESLSGFDIDAITGEAYAALRANGSVNLYLIDLGADAESAAAVAIGVMGIGGVRGLALKPALRATIFGLTNNNELLSFDAEDHFATLPSAVQISGIDSGDTLVGIDFRNDGTLTALANSGKLYTVNPAATTVGAVTSHVATKVGALTASGDDNTFPFSGLTGTDFGLDFEPNIGKDFAGLRIMNETGGQYLRSNSVTGETFTDSALAYPLAAELPCSAARPTLNIGSAAYDRNGVLFVIDADANAACLYKAAAAGGSMTAGSFLFGDGPQQGLASAKGGFDIVGGHDGLALAAFQRANTADTQIAPIDLSPLAGAVDTDDVRTLTGVVLNGLAIQLKYAN